MKRIAAVLCVLCLFAGGLTAAEAPPEPMRIWLPIIGGEPWPGPSSGVLEDTWGETHAYRLALPDKSMSAVEAGYYGQTFIAVDRRTKKPMTTLGLYLVHDVKPGAQAITNAPTPDFRTRVLTDMFMGPDWKRRRYGLWDTIAIYERAALYRDEAAASNGIDAIERKALWDAFDQLVLLGLPADTAGAIWKTLAIDGAQ